VYFEAGQATLKPDARATLDRQAAWLSRYGQVNVLIADATDEREGGTPAAERSLALGQRRANSVRDYLLVLGITASRIATISYGKDRPTAAGATEQARAQDRTAVTSLR
jgi:peptidoglycan-associated lipoprotein